MTPRPGDRAAAFPPHFVVRAAGLVLAGYLYHKGYRRAEDAATGDVGDVLDTWALYGAAFTLMAGSLWFGARTGSVADWMSRIGNLAVSINAEIERHIPRWVAHHGAQVALLAMGLYHLLPVVRDFYVANDGALFTHQAVDLLLSGRNPYQFSMAEAFDRFPVDPGVVTFRVDGSVVTSFSYPALAFLAFVPQRLLGLVSLDITAIVCLVAAAVIVSQISIGPIRWAPMWLMVVDPDMLDYAAGGVGDSVWLLPLVIAVIQWSRRRFGASGLLLGLACAVKPTPWMLCPFLGIWLLQDQRRSPRSVRRFAAGVAAGFAAPNLPFVLHDPTAWLQGVLMPLGSGGALVPHGVGAVLLSSSGNWPLPSWHFTLVTTVVALGLISVYACHVDRMAWFAWIAAPFILWFGHRALHNYFLYFPLVAMCAVSCEARAGQLLTGATLRAPETRRRLAVITPVVVSVVVGIVGVSGWFATRAVALQVESRLIAGADPARVGRFSELFVTLRNREAWPVTPVFEVTHAAWGSPTFWSIIDGPSTLAPDQEATLHLRAPSWVASVPYGAPTVMKAHALGTDRRQLVAKRSLRERVSRLANPTWSAWWQPARSPVRVPVGWRLARADLGAYAWSVSGAAGAGVELSMHPDGPVEIGSAGLLGLEQSVDAGTCLSLDFTPTRVTAVTAGRPASYPTGIELSANGASVRLIAADVSEPTLGHPGPQETGRATIYVPASPAARTHVRVALDDLLASTFLRPFRRDSSILRIFIGASADAVPGGNAAMFHQVSFCDRDVAERIGVVGFKLRPL